MADPLDASNDPNSQRILALIAARQAEQASALNAPPMAPVGSINMGTNPLAPVMAPPTPALVPGAATPTANVPPQVSPATMAPAMPNLAAPAAPNVAEEKPQPGIAKRLLTNFLYGGGQALLHRVGLPTDYEQQQRDFEQGQAQLTQSRLQQGADDMTAYRTAQVGGLQSKANKLDTLNELVTIPNEPIFGRFAGQQVTRGAFEALAPILTRGQTSLQNTEAKGDNAMQLEQLKQAGGNPRDHVLRSVGGVVGLYSKRDGSLVKSLGADTAMITGPRNAIIRAQANAQYGVSNVMDDEENPIAVSRLTQLQTGAPTMTEKSTQTLAGDKLGAATYLAANKIVRKNISVLRDNTQRGIIARATEDAERNPGAIDSIVNSAIQQGLSPQGAQLISAMKQMNEFGSAFKKYTGNGGSSTDSLRATIHANQPSSANSEQVNLNLLSQDEKLAQGVLKNLARPSKYSVPAKNTTSAPAAPASNGGHPSFFHPIANQ